MTNMLNTIIANQPIHQEKKDVLPAFTFDATGKIKPLDYKGKLLPSKIFASPKEYAHDLKKDILSIGKAAKGQANDYELGRINDLAMKTGALGLATYLLIKNPLKLSKAMEFIGVGTFFGGMALWPKLMIQAPLKARTGVDIHQKYIDSQGRKKMLHQDPQYDLTDLYSREELDVMGDKLKVNEKLPDRDNFIKQRARKVAVQGNTLWMMSAFVTPIISALSCKALEKPVENLIERAELLSSSVRLENGPRNGFVQRIKNFFADKAFEKFLKQNATRPMDERLITELSERLAQGTNSANLQGAIKEQITGMKPAVKLSETILRSAVRNIVPENVFTALTTEEKTLLSSYVSEGKIADIASFLAKKIPGIKPKDLAQAPKQISQAINKSLESAGSQPMTEEVVSKVRSLRTSLRTFSAKRDILDKFIGTRVGNNAGSFNARQWGRVFNSFLKALKLSDKELKQIADGNMEVLDSALARLSKDDRRFAKTIEKLLSQITRYEDVTGSEFTKRVGQKAAEMCTSAHDELAAKGFSVVAETIKSSGAKTAGTVEKTIVSGAKDAAVGEVSSFYRLLQFLDVHKQTTRGYETLASNIREALRKEGINEPSKELISKLVKAAKNIAGDATTADHVTKLAGDGFHLSKTEFKVLTDVLYGLTDSTSGIEHVVQQSKGQYAQEFLKGYRSYRRTFIETVANCENSVTPKLTGYVHSAKKAADQNFTIQNNLIGSTMTDAIQKRAKNMYNTNKWLKIFGISFAVISAATLIAGLAFGKKSKMEKEAEKKLEKNG